MTDLRDKKCLITGAASGIGRATAIGAAREGAELFLTDINAAGLESASSEIRAAVSLICPGAVDTGLVETIDIVSIDRQTQDEAKMKDRFRKHAIKPEDAAAAIIRGMKRNQYLVFTSRDIAVGHWFQRKFAPP